jgi:hypothetical protein
MPGPVSKQYHGPGATSPYVPSWCYDGGNPPKCYCGHHHGYHDCNGQCNQRRECGCKGYDGANPEVLADAK